MWTLIGAILIAAAPSSDVPVLRADVRPDGRLEPSEWAGAREVRLEGMRIRLGRRGDVLAVAVARGPGHLQPGARDGGPGLGAARLWIANVDRSGTRTREFLVDLQRFGASGTPLALVVTGLVLPDRARR